MDELLNARLAELAQAISRLERKSDFILRHLDLEYVDQPADSVPPHLVAVLALLKQGKRTEALREYRQITGASAAAAMAELSKLEVGLPPR